MITSTELIDFTGMSAANIKAFLGEAKKQNMTEITIRFPAYSDAVDGVPDAALVASARNIIDEAYILGIGVNVDLHTWMKSSNSTYMTWDTAFDTSVATHLTKRATYLTYIQNVILALNGCDVKAWMVLNEPQAQTANSSENQFIRDCISRAKLYTSKPVGVRFMGGYSPSTGHYAPDIDVLTDFMARNIYWDPRAPNTSKYGVNNATMEKMLSTSASLGKPLWVTEFGYPCSSPSDPTQAEAQRAYFKAWVDYANSKSFTKIFGWSSKPQGTGETFNLFNGYTPRPAFLELKNVPPNPCQPYIDQIAALNATVNNQLDTIQILDDRIAELESEVSSLKGKMDTARATLTY